MHTVLCTSLNKHWETYIGKGDLQTDFVSTENDLIFVKVLWFFFPYRTNLWSWIFFLEQLKSLKEQIMKKILYKTPRENMRIFTVRTFSVLNMPTKLMVFIPKKKQMFLKHCLEVPSLDLVDVSFYSNWIWKPDSF